MKKTILEQANDIVFGKIREKEGEYGPFIESMARGARIASELTRKEITTDDFYKCMIALKLSRIAYSHKQDTYLDAIAYIASNFEYKEQEDAINKDQLKIDFDEIGNVGSKIIRGMEALSKFKWENIKEFPPGEKRQSIPVLDLKQWFWDMQLPFNPADYQGMEDIYRKHCTLMANNIIESNTNNK